MKLLPFFLPALALIGSGFWLGQNHATIRELTTKTNIIRERLDNYESSLKSAALVDLCVQTESAADSFTLPDGSPDWTAIIAAMSANSRETGMPLTLRP